MIRLYNKLTSQLTRTFLRRHVAQSVAPRIITIDNNNPLENTASPTPSLQEQQQQQQQQCHNPTITLYDYEASPWCRLVREYLTILDLICIIRPCPRETLFAQGAYSPQSRYRPLAAREIQHLNDENNNKTCNDADVTTLNHNQQQQQQQQQRRLTFPLLIDETSQDHRLIITESFDIISHLWNNVDNNNTTLSKVDGSISRPDQLLNSSRIPFPIRFALLAGPSLIRPFPWCGLMRYQSRQQQQQHRQAVQQRDNDERPLITLYQYEGCHESVFVREALCSLEISYVSVPMAQGTVHSVLEEGWEWKNRPILVDGANDDDKRGSTNTVVVIEGGEDAAAYLFERYGLLNDKRSPTWFDPVPVPNEGERLQQTGTFQEGVGEAIQRGWHRFVPDDVL